MLHSRVATRTAVVAVFAAAVSVAFVLPTSTTQDGMAEERAAKNPGAEIIAAQVGTWAVEYSGGGMPDGTGTSVIRSIGGEWASESFMSEGYEGAGLWGWDAGKKKFVGVWVGTGESKMALSEGVWDEATRTMTNDPQEVMLATGLAMTIGKLVLVDDDHMLFTVHRADAEEGAEPEMTFHYTRKQ
ncbi:MAG: DUF1579 family protein [Planctomycetota bacterium]|jgi:hypothetical protein